MIRRWIGIVILIFILLLLGAAGAIGWAISSETGSRWLVVQLQQWLPGELRVGALQGRFLDVVRLEDFSYGYQDWRVEASVLELTWQIKGGGVEIQRLQGEGLQLRIPEFKDQLIVIPDLASPIPVQIDNLQLAPVTVIYADNPPITLDSIALQANAADTLNVSQLQVRSSHFELDATGKMDLHIPHELAIHGQWSTDLELDDKLVKWRGKSVIGGNPQHLILANQITYPTLIDMQGVVDNLPDVLSKVRWSLQCRWDELQWPLQDQPAQWQSQEAHLEAKGSFKSYQLSLQTRLSGNHVPPGLWTLQARGDAEQLTVQSLQGEVLEGQLHAKGQARWQPAFTAQLQATAQQLAFTELWSDWPEGITANGDLVAEWGDQVMILKELAITSPEHPEVIVNMQGQATSLLDGSPQFQGQLNWQALRWPLTGKAQFESAQGHLAMEGASDAYQASFVGQLVGPQIPQGRWQGRATGDLKGLQIESLRGQVLEGVVKAQGELNWEAALDWQVAVTGEKLNPASRWQNWPGELALTLDSHGRWQEGRLETQVDVPAIKGQLRGYPVSLKTQFAVQEDQFQVDNLDLKSGTSRLTANLRLGDTLRGTWLVAIPDLADLLPEAGGSLHSTGEIGGTFQKPIVTANLLGDRLRLQENRLRRLQAQVTTQKYGHIRMQGELENLRWGKNRLLTHLNLSGQGDFVNHQATITAKIPKSDLTMRLQGGFTEAQAMNWQGTLQQLSLNSEAFGDWALNKSPSLKVSPTAVSLASSCLRNRGKGGAICTELDWQSENTGTVIQLDLSRVPLGLGQVFFSEAWSMNGTLNGNVMGRISPQGTLRSEAVLRITPGTVTVGWEGAKVTRRHQGGELQNVITAQGLQGDLLLRLEKQGSIKASLAMPRFTQLPIADKQPVSGRLSVARFPVGLLPVVSWGIEDVKGSIEAAITLDGTLDQPRLRGQASIRNGAAKLPDLGLDLKDLQLTAKTIKPSQVAAKTTPSNRIRLNGKVQSGGGWAYLTGNIDLESLPQWQITANLTGADLEIIDTSTVQLLVSPDLSVKVMPETLDVQGDLKIPQGKVTPVISAFTQDAVRVSDDTVIVNSSEEVVSTTEQDHTWRTSGRVRLQVDPKVTLQLADFRSRLQGTLIITKQPQDRILGNGELRLLDGEYRAYGQDLQVRQGVIAFVNEPIFNPSLDIKATRRIYGDKPIIFAGVQITGRLKSPRFSLFSEPPLENQGEILSYLTLGDALNLDEDNGNDPVSLGIYLLPNFYISYGINRVEDEKVYSMRYELGERFWIEGEFIEGKFNQGEHGIDFSYTIER